MTRWQLTALADAAVEALTREVVKCTERHRDDCERADALLARVEKAEASVEVLEEKLRIAEEAAAAHGAQLRALQESYRQPEAELDRLWWMLRRFISMHANHGPCRDRCPEDGLQVDTAIAFLESEYELESRG